MPPHLRETVHEYLDNAEQPEQEAIDLFLLLMSRFGWTGVIMTKRDVETVVERELTEEEFKEITRTRAWRKAAGIWHDMGFTWDTVVEAVQESGINNLEDLPLEQELAEDV